MSPIAKQRLEKIADIYLKEDELRNEIVEKLIADEIAEDAFRVAPNSRLPLERAYFTEDMLAKNEACTDALQLVVDCDGEDDDAWAAFENHFSKYMSFTWGSTWDGKKYDLVLYGVSGYTGYLTMQYLKRISLKKTPEPYTFAFAGRTVSKVVTMRDRNFSGTEYADTTILRAAYDDPVSVMDMCKSARAIINVAGPYMLTPGELLIDCCCWTGTHYFDINGELPWMLRLCELHERAKGSGAIIMPCAAMAGGIAQQMTTFLMHGLREEYGQQEELLECAHYGGGGGTGGGTSGGTLGSRLAMNQASDRVRMAMADPFTLGGFIPKRDDNGLKEFNIKSGTGQATTRIRPMDQDAFLAKISEDKVNNVYRAPHTYAFFDTRIARRTNALMADAGGGIKPWGREPTWHMHILITKEAMAQGAMQSSMLLAGAGGAGVAGEKEALMKAGKYYAQGEGPPLEDLGDAWVAMFQWVQTVNGHQARASWCGGDGYFETARVMIECAMCCLFDHDELDVKEGVITAGSCCSLPTIRRMINTGIIWKPDGWLTDAELGPPPGCMGSE